MPQELIKSEKKFEGKDKATSEMKNKLPLSVQGRKDSSGILIKITEKPTKEMKIA